MNTPATLRFLGTGGSMGIPVIGCDCEVCTSSDPHNKRQRTSALVTVGEKKILIDCGPDFHTQALHYHINTLDGVILTHAHRDHTAGIDELRVYHMRSHKPIPCLLSPETLADVKHQFNYIFKEDSFYKLTAKLDLHLLPEARGEVEFLGLPIHYFTYEQARMKVNGFRFGNLAYITDIYDYPETIFQDLHNVEILILSALRFTPSQLHLSLDEAVEFSNRIAPKKTWFIHIAHEVDHQRSNAYLPENIKLAYDGMLVDFVI